MAEVTVRIVDYIYNTKFEDLPDEVVHETKRVLLDSIGCAIVGHPTNIGSTAVKFAIRQGEAGESSIIGINKKVSCINAAFANGELINALDFDAGSSGHDSPIIIASSLSAAETAGASGKDLLLAIALGHEITTRMMQAEGDVFTVKTDKSGVAKVKLAPSYVYAYTTMASSMVNAKLMRLNRDKMAAALGIAGTICPPDSGRKFLDVTPVNMTKYGLLGWAAKAAVSAALLSDTGFTGDTEILDGDYCFWKHDEDRPWLIEPAIQGLGSKWLQKISYKRYPANYPVAGALDCLAEIIENNKIQPADIQEIKLRIWPITQYKYIKDNKLASQEDHFFSPVYASTCLAHSINPSHWQKTATRQDPRLQEFMRRVKFDIGCDEAAFQQARLEDPSATLCSAEVITNGESYYKKSLYRIGVPQPKEFKITDEELILKFKENVAAILPSDRIEEIVKMIFSLESLSNVMQLMEKLKVD